MIFSQIVYFAEVMQIKLVVVCCFIRIMLGEMICYNIVNKTPVTKTLLGEFPETVKIVFEITFGIGDFRAYVHFIHFLPSDDSRTT